MLEHELPAQHAEKQERHRRRRRPQRVLSMYCVKPVRSGEAEGYVGIGQARRPSARPTDRPTKQALRRGAAQQRAGWRKQSAVRYHMTESS